MSFFGRPDPEAEIHPKKDTLIVSRDKFPDQLEPDQQNCFFSWRNNFSILHCFPRSSNGSGLPVYHR